MLNHATMRKELRHAISRTPTEREYNRAYNRIRSFKVKLRYEKERNLSIVNEAQRQVERAEAAEARNAELERKLDDAIKLAQVARVDAEAAEAKLAASADELKRLMLDTDVVLSELNPQEIKGAINWGDLFAAEATRVFDADHRTWLRIVIEEVSPGTETLIDAVRTGLAAKGWDVAKIAIETEW